MTKKDLERRLRLAHRDLNRSQLELGNTHERLTEYARANINSAETIEKLKTDLRDANSDVSTHLRTAREMRTQRNTAADLLKLMHSQYNDLTPVDFGVYVGRVLGILEDA